MHPVVTVTRGEHGHPIPDGLGEMVTQELAARGVSGEFNLRMGPTVLGTPSMARLKVVRVTARGTVELRCKPGGNDSARVCWLSLAQGSKTTDMMGEANKLAAVLSNSPTNGDNGMVKVHGPGYGFTAQRENVDNTLKVLCASGARNKFIHADRAKRALMDSGVGKAGMTRASWGQVFGALSRQGLLDIERRGDDLVAVRVPEKHVPRGMLNGGGGGFAPLSTGRMGFSPNPDLGVPMPSTVGREGMVSWLRQLAAVEELLLGKLVDAENREKQAQQVYEAAKGEADEVREQLAKAGKAVGAAKLLLEMVKG